MFDKNTRPPPPIFTSLSSMMPSILRAPSIIIKTTVRGPDMSPNLTINARLAARSCCSVVWCLLYGGCMGGWVNSSTGWMVIDSHKMCLSKRNVGGGVYTPVHLQSIDSERDVFSKPPSSRSGTAIEPRTAMCVTSRKRKEDASRRTFPPNLSEPRRRTGIASSADQT